MRKRFLFHPRHMTVFGGSAVYRLFKSMNFMPNLFRVKSLSLGEKSSGLYSNFEDAETCNMRRRNSVKLATTTICGLINPFYNNCNQTLTKKVSV